tara:strand:+ start:4012 stop:4374 length:363 start_codon:yes stop_codon:yes gene_type:complete
VETVATNVKYHLSQETTNQSIVVIASRIINQIELKEVVDDLEIEVLVVTEEITAVVGDLEEIDRLEKCTKQHVETVATNVKYHLSQEIPDQFIVQTALKTISEINSEYKKIKMEYNYLPL